MVDGLDLNTKEPSKRAYTTPELHVFGDIRQLTKAVGNMGLTDGGTVVGFMMTGT
jgi:hypothetical protein